MSEIDEKIAQEKAKLPQIDFQKPKQENSPVVKDSKEELINSAFEQATISELQNNDNLKERVLSTAEKYVGTKMQVIETEVDTQHKKAVYDNSKDACVCYGSTEATAPTWAVKLMSTGYNIMFALWIILASFTVMPVVFLMKKVQVAFKQTWLALLVALIIYLSIVVGIPLLTKYKIL